MSHYFNLADSIFEGVGKYDIPQIYSVPDIECFNWIGFNLVKTTEENKSEKGVHFFIDDYQFERCWTYPNRYGNILSEYRVCLAPDFSQYFDFPKATQIYNHYRKHWLARYWQEMGLTVIPTIGWSSIDSFEWCFDGEPRNAVVAVSNLGCMNSKESRYAFRLGYEKMLEILNPKKILLFAHTIENYPGPVHYIEYKYWGNNYGGR